MTSRRDYRTRLDRILVPVLTGPLGRGGAFALELGGAIVRGLRGERRHPEQAPPPGESR